MTAPADRPSVLHSVAGMLSRPVAKDELLRAMVDRVVAELDAERGTLYLLDALTGELCSRVAHLPEIEEIRLAPGHGVASRVAMTGEPALIDDAAADEHFFPGIDEQTGYRTRNMIAVPVREGDSIRGVLQLLNRRRGAFAPEHVERLTALAAQVADALSHTSMRPVSGRDSGLLIDGPFNNVVGESEGMYELYRRVLAAAPTDATVLVRGETGTGKTLIARAIHECSPRQQGPFVHLDCAALPGGLIESELFGHERGAFTGADRRVSGKLELAAGGTLFLDEIGEVPAALQVKLLRFLQSGELERVGGRETMRPDVRVIAATNADLEGKVADGTFRQDLYYRVRVVELRVLPLRERGPGDVQRLAEHFLDLFARKYRRPVRAIDPAALARLQAHAWPGNVRELEHCIESAVVLCPGDTIAPQHLSLPELAGAAAAPDAPPGYPPEMPLAEVERAHIRRALEHCGGNRSEAARLLGIGRNTLARKLADE